MKLAEIAVSLQLGTKLIMCLLSIKRRLVTIFCRGGPNTVILIKVKIGSAFGSDRCRAILFGPGCSSISEAFHLKEPLRSVLHIRIVAELLAGLLQILDALLTLTEGLEATRQIILRDDGQLHTCLISSATHIIRSLSWDRACGLSRIDAIIGRRDADA